MRFFNTFSELEIDEKILKLAFDQFDLHYVDEEHFFFVANGKNEVNKERKGRAPVSDIY
jgi:hypothetical protein